MKRITKRITIDIPDQLHHDLTIHVAYIKSTQKDFVTNLLKEKLRFEQHPNEEKRLPQS